MGSQVLGEGGLVRSAHRFGGTKVLIAEEEICA